MGKLTGQTISRSVDKFLSTYMGLKENQRQEEDRADEKRYRDFYLQLQQNADKRAEDSHKQDKEEWAVKQEALVREAEARQDFLDKMGTTYEAWSMMNPVEQFKMNQETHALAKELNQLQIESGRFNLEQARTQAPYELQRAKYLASGGARGAGPTMDKALEGKYKQLAFQQSTIEKRLETYATKDPVTGATSIAWDRVPEPLLMSYRANSQAMTDLESQMIPLQREQLGLGNYDPGTAIMGPGSSEEQPADPVSKFLSDSGGQTKPTPEQQKTEQLFRNKLGDLSNRRMVYVDPRTKQLQATNDVGMLEKVKAQNGGKIEVYEQGIVPTWAIGKTVEDWKRYEKEKERQSAGFALGPGGAGMMR